jgi:hypothetical protein
MAESNPGALKEIADATQSPAQFNQLYGGNEGMSAADVADLAEMSARLEPPVAVDAAADDADDDASDSSSAFDFGDD